MPWYLTIRSDPTYSRSTHTEPLVGYILSSLELVQTGPQEFRNAPTSPWVVLVMATADETGCYAVNTLAQPTANVVELICGDGDESWYESLAIKVASFLSWEAVDEHEERVIRSAEET
ncbi:hypothetical protein GobsT_65220 [Gemmata obscuriglobus]|uniref:Uncharacterized protein n=1 Tax=Gemmata obscuriglobus TaxID=114 RepID=A0A2Z3GPQ0_9BACT|nr:hypothetical protein C1280_01245 [Gemmata obscuriglobus]QEG31678.1 hypothetical protein GobsT_65220 [Gemmata obscuriglobus]VTS11024.1 Uncharacterized protein OS=Chamaesiphon minutus PCC 6605 GN=Cha6605_1043 PE=4 SV=1 [Gemmata obscuriglobus UQM 2246]